MTEKLLEKPSKLILVEKDKELSDYLKKFGDSIEIINNDILEYLNNIKYNKPIKVFGNLPYNISTKILISFIKLTNLEKFFSKFLFVFQKEVADRIVAEYNTKPYGRLSILTSWKMVSSKNSIFPQKVFTLCQKYGVLWSYLNQELKLKIYQTQKIWSTSQIYFLIKEEK